MFTYKIPHITTFRVPAAKIQSQLMTRRRSAPTYGKW